MTTDYGEGVVRRFWEDIFSRGDIDAMDEIFARGYTLHDLVYNEVHDLMGAKRIARDTYYRIPGMRVVVEDQRLEADGRVFTHFTVCVSPPEGAETYGRSTPPGDGWEYSGMSISRVVEGKIEETWLVWEAIRAAEELESVFAILEWRWPPWR